MPKRKTKPTPERQEPGPGRSTSQDAFDDLRREIAQRNERAHQEALKPLAARARRQILQRREMDL